MRRSEIRPATDNPAYFSGKCWHLGDVEKLYARAADSAHRIDEAIE